jgi:hypothetical protein
MRILLSLSAVLLLSACGSVTPKSLWDDVMDYPSGWRDYKDPSPTDGLPDHMSDDDSMYKRKPSVMVEDRLVDFPEPTQITK